MEMGSKKEAQIEGILAQSLETFMEEAEDFVMAEICEDCDRSSELCFPCVEATIQINTLLTFLLSESARWN